MLLLFTVRHEANMQTQRVDVEGSKPSALEGNGARTLQVNQFSTRLMCMEKQWARWMNSSKLSAEQNKSLRERNYIDRIQMDGHPTNICGEEVGSEHNRLQRRQLRQVCSGGGSRLIALSPE
jgi:hypothetical protein